MVDIDFNKLNDEELQWLRKERLRPLFYFIFPKLDGPVAGDSARISPIGP